MNTITLIGYVGKDAESLTFGSGDKVTSFMLATTERGYTLQNGDKMRDQTDWHNIVCYQHLAEFAEKWAKKGQPLRVVGRMRYREYTDNQGEKRIFPEVVAKEIEILPQKKQLIMEESNKIEMFREITAKVEIVYEYDFAVIAIKNEQFNPIKEIGEVINYLAEFVGDKAKFDNFGEIILCEIAALSIAKIMIINGSDIKTKNMSQFREITKLMINIYKRKNHDYGDSFGETFRKLGLISAITRITDKYNRLVSLATKGEQQVNDEKLEDTLIDLANYAVMTIMEIRNQEKNIISENIEKPE